MRRGFRFLGIIASLILLAPFVALDILQVSEDGE